jgi:hypothetical protein
MPFTERPLTKWYPYYLADSVRKKAGYLYDDFKGGSPFMWTNATTVPSLPTASITQVDSIITPAGNYYHFYQTSEQTILPAFVAGGGLDLACDEVNNEVCELVPGGNDAASSLARVIGTSPDFFIKAKITLADASGSDQAIIGWRKQEAFAVPVSFLTTGDPTYTDVIGIGFAGTKADPNPIRMVKDLNDAGSCTVQAASFTWADTLTHVLEMRVIGRRAYFYINGCILGSKISRDGDNNSITAQNTVSGPNWSFDSGDTVIPFIFVRHDGDVLESFVIEELEIGALRDAGLARGDE